MDEIKLEPLLEGLESGSPSKREVVLTIIKAGWGNSAHGHYYPAEALQEAATRGVFNNVKMYADHMSENQRKLLGHLPRSVRDLTGRIIETWWDAPSRTLKGRAKLVPWFYDLVSSDPELVEASINAGGRAVPRSIEGRRGRFVEAIVKADSVDWVSVGGAGGRVDSLLEAHMEEQREMYEDLTVDTLIEAKPALIKELLDSALNERAVAAETKLQEAEQKLAEVEATKPAGETSEIEPVVEAAPALTEDKVTEIVGSTIEEKVPGIVASVVTQMREADAADRAFDAKVTKLAEAHKGLPKSAVEEISTEFAGQRSKFETDDALQEAVDSRAKKLVEMFQEAGVRPRGVTGLGASASTETLQESAASRRRGGANDMVDRAFGLDEQPSGESKPE